ncbi:MAG: outer membrane beta-barrel protein [Bacteroidia bacterium]|nr:outer membrane beta-barrel protein [Bacteroidia bacterium]HQU99989.1 outer membrane beta-barrel protein [Bacteroidia bacterium]
MKKTLFLLAIASFALLKSQAQFVLNPQAGITAQTAIKALDNEEFKARVGYTLGTDARFGSRFYFQPGLYFSAVTSEYQYEDGVDTTDYDYKTDFQRQTLKLNAKAGYNIVHKDGFKLRVNAGPSFDVLLNAKSDNDAIDDDDFKKGFVNLDAGVGLDIWFVSVDLSASYGLTKAFDNTTTENNTRFLTGFLTVGIVLGNGLKD